MIEGFTVTGMPRAGIRAVADDHVTIRDNNGDHNGRWGIFTGFSDDLLIENNTTSPLAGRARHLRLATAATGPSSAATSSGATTRTAST